MLHSITRYYDDNVKIKRLPHSSESF